MNDYVPAPAEILRRLRPIPTYRDHPASTGHDVVGVAPGGEALVISVVDSSDPVLLLFLSSGCLGCGDFWVGAGELGQAVGSGVRVVVVTRDPDSEDVPAVLGLAAGLVGAGVAVVMSTQAYEDYRVGGPPFYALAAGPVVRTEGVAWGVVETAEAIRRALSEQGLS